jgi:nucleotide-binding universal stress UspA family protein
MTPNRKIIGASRWHDLSQAWLGMDEARTLRLGGLRCIVVPLDGSTVAEHALPLALAIARRTGATIRLVHVHSVWESVPDPWQVSLFDLRVGRVRKEKQAYLRNIAKRIGKTNQVALSSVLIESSEIAGSLCRSACGADLVVMATNGYGPWGRLLRGSVTDAVTQHLSCPAVMVRGYDAPVDLTGDPFPRHIVLPLCGTTSDRSVLSSVAAFATFSGANLTLVNMPGCQRQHGDTMKYLQHIATRLNEMFQSGACRVASTGTTKALLSFLRDSDAEMVALTTCARRPWSRFVRPEVADSVFTRCRLPMLLLRSSPQDEPSARCPAL